MNLGSTDRKREQPVAGSRGLLLPGLSLAVCLSAPIAILALTLPDEYLSLDGEGEAVLAVFIVPALQWLACPVIGVVLAIDAWRRRLQESNQPNQEPAE